MTKEVFKYRTFTRLKQLEYLIRTQQIDPQFFWTSEVADIALDGGKPPPHGRAQQAALRAD